MPTSSCCNKYEEDEYQTFPSALASSLVAAALHTCCCLPLHYSFLLFSCNVKVLRRDPVLRLKVRKDLLEQVALHRHLLACAPPQHRRSDGAAAVVNARRARPRARGAASDARTMRRLKRRQAIGVRGPATTLASSHRMRELRSGAACRCLSWDVRDKGGGHE